MGSSSRLEALEKRRVFFLCLESNHNSSGSQTKNKKAQRVTEDKPYKQ